ncbi:oxygen-independent coproporphyrinogen-3 oxidase [Pacificibacter maritimus]|uniref:Heme chaperone HemW n=1 Tax=Pacificibacter maritimus TaxID=762213 RepID=A0A3N4U1L5_9RHOB|nr:radical SAM family heme chaperone HemW [Pacificibacter maritimus]RPE64713.1 oxygen-independent coproporphyrinogen-3 oxidase [Pacificibacter maritimus]
MEDWQNGGFGLYIHWPFCQAKCPYCDFNSHVSASINEESWKAAFLSEIDRVANLTQGRLLNSVFFGGGTPSLMSPDLVNALLDRVRSSWTLANDCEITLEANPTSVEAGRFIGYHEAGVNRLSMGIQSLRDADLKALGRMHTVAEARSAFDIARNTFDRISFDLIYARQQQSLNDWKNELTEALDMAADHLSLYQLTIEEGTAFGERYSRGKLRNLPTEDTATDMYFATQEICDAAGMSAYEVSNHAQNGSESRHNEIYWRYGDYIGIGPGAHGRLTLDGEKYATDTLLSPGLWLEKVRKTGSGEHSRSLLPPDEQLTEFLLMGLRLADGIDLARAAEISGNPLEVTNQFLFEDGLVKIEKGRLMVTPKGRPLLNAVLREIIP